MPSIDDVDKMIDMLERIQKRPGMYIPPGLDSLVGFLLGFGTACWALDVVDPDLKAYDQVVSECGWELRSIGPWREMGERGMTDEAIRDEMLVIEMEYWKRLKNKLAQ